MEPASVATRRHWWFGTGLTGYLGIRPGFTLASFYAGSSLAVGGWLVFELFRHAGIAAMRPAGNLANVAFLLAVWQLLCFLATRPSWRADLFQDPPGPLLPYTAGHRLALWTTIVIAPIVLALVPAYAGVLSALPGLGTGFVLATWLVDAAALSALALGFDVWRWLFRTYAPLPLQRLWALLVIGVGNIAIVGLGVVCFVVALQFGVRRVFVSDGMTAVLQRLAAAPQAAPLRGAVRQHRQRFEGFDNISAISALVTEGRPPSVRVSLARGAALAAVLLLIGAFPGRRPEEQDRITRFAYVVDEWATNATVRVCPRRLRVAWRLMLPGLYGAIRGAALAGFFMMTTTFFMTWDFAAAAGVPRRIDRVIVTTGGCLAMVLALAQVPLANGLGFRASDYLRYATLPLPTQQLLRRMVLVALCGGALVGASVAITWALIVQRDLAVALLFSTGVACLLVAALAMHISVIAACWSLWQRVGSVFALAWVIVPAAILIWQFHLLRSSPQLLPSVTAVEAAASIVGAGAAWFAIGRMVARREPTAGL